MSNSFWKGAPNSFVEMGELNKERITMEVIPFKLARDIISKHHYTHTLNRANICLGFYIDGKLNTVMVYGRASISHDKMLNSLPGDYFELVRLFSFDWAGKNMESYCIGQSIKYIKENYPHIKCLIAFSDPEQGHIGTIYQSTNWLYCGITDKVGGYQFYIDGKWQHPRNTVLNYGTRKTEEIKKLFPGVKMRRTPRKYRYIYLLAKNKKERKELMSNLKYKVLPYPKDKDEILRYN